MVQMSWHSVEDQLTEEVVRFFFGRLHTTPIMKYFESLFFLYSIDTLLSGLRTNIRHILKLIVHFVFYTIDE